MLDLFQPWLMHKTPLLDQSSTTAHTLPDYGQGEYRSICKPINRGPNLCSLGLRCQIPQAIQFPIHGHIMGDYQIGGGSKGEVTWMCLRMLSWAIWVGDSVCFSVGGTGHAKTAGLGKEMVDENPMYLSWRFKQVCVACVPMSKVLEDCVAWGKEWNAISKLLVARGLAIHYWHEHEHREKEGQGKKLERLEQKSDREETVCQ